MDRSDSKGHVLNKDSDWLIFKRFVTGYSRREGAFEILIGTELRPVKPSAVGWSSFELLQWFGLVCVET